MTAGTLTITKTALTRGVQRVVLAWTSSTGGAVDGHLTSLYGRIVRATFDPVDGPSANYDVTLLDEEGVDLLGGTGANRHTTNTETTYPLLGTVPDVPAVVAGRAELQVSGAGSAKSGRLVLHLTRP